MTPLKDCMMIAYLLDYTGEVIDGYPVMVDLRYIGEFLTEEAGMRDFIETGYVMQAQDWPLHNYPECLCGDTCEGDTHYLLQLGADDFTVGDEDWEEWELAVHKPCLPGFFELLTGGVFIADQEDWLRYRDDPLPLDRWR